MDNFSPKKKENSAVSYPLHINGMLDFAVSLINSGVYCLLADYGTHARGFPRHFKQLQSVQRTEPIFADISEREHHTGGRIAKPTQRK